ncbi:hypothetical protein [Desulfobulbus sp.]|uniref:hypothetical protein n=1 Tax=Desulfobulbus sp. TaxID=895 RepID=UPI00286F8722|nr:hypothetical protein [Desulfobulbus sp.]
MTNNTWTIYPEHGQGATVFTDGAGLLKEKGGHGLRHGASLARMNATRTISPLFWKSMPLANQRQACGQSGGEGHNSVKVGTLFALPPAADSDGGGEPGCGKSGRSRRWPRELNVFTPF